MVILIHFKLVKEDASIEHLKCGSIQTWQKYIQDGGWHVFQHFYWWGSVPLECNVQRRVLNVFTGLHWWPLCVGTTTEGLWDLNRVGATSRDQKWVKIHFEHRCTLNDRHPHVSWFFSPYEDAELICLEYYPGFHFVCANSALNIKIMIVNLDRIYPCFSRIQHQIVLALI